jgi:TetR/AcrR family transcriptional regulator, transcriptional repressor for nem operon
MMARTVNAVAHRAKRDAILDHALLLVQTKGYEQMSIQDLLDGLGISRGAFYHYFDSKQAVLEALVDRMGSEAANAVLPIIEDPQLTAVQKFHRYVDESTAFKGSHRELISDVLRVWYSDENLRLRHRLSAATLDYTAPMIIEPIIRQGIDEQIFDTRYPTISARIIAAIWLNLADDLIELFADGEPENLITERAAELFEATTDSIERILAAPPGSLRFPDEDQLVRLTRLVQQPPRRTAANKD